MACESGVQCGNCSFQCKAVPFPVSEAMRLLGDKESFTMGMKLLQGEIFFVVCQEEKKFVLVKMDSLKGGA